jgi:hypothetical protein
MIQIKEEKVRLTVTQLTKDLSEGLTWYTKDDKGFGSIEAKYSIPEAKIPAIEQLEQLKNIPTTIRVFEIVDDTKKTEVTNTPKNETTKEPEPRRTNSNQSGQTVTLESTTGAVGVAKTNQDVSAFLNL